MVVRDVVWTNHAHNDLDEVVSYIAGESHDGACAVLEQALAAADSLATLSERGRMVPELDDPMIREVFVHGYRLIYEVTASQIRVLAFLHGARDFRRWRSK